MDEKFMENLRSISVADVLQEPRPSTSKLRKASAAGTARRVASLSVNPTTTLRNQQMLAQDQEDNEITTLANYRPESAAFTFTFPRPTTGRLGTARVSRSLSSAITSSRQPQGNWDSSGFNNVRPMSSTRSLTRIPDESSEYIPDLDEVQEQDLAMTVAAAPLFEMQKITSLKELDAELLQSKPFVDVNGVDLRKLCKFVVPEKDLVEPDEYWTWDRLYTEILSTPEISHLVRFHKKEME